MLVSICSQVLLTIFTRMHRTVMSGMLLEAFVVVSVCCVLLPISLSFQEFNERLY